MNEDIKKDPFDDLEEDGKNSPNEEKPGENNEKEKKPQAETPPNAPKASDDRVDYLVVKDKVGDFLSESDNSIYAPYAKNIIEKAQLPENRNKPIEEIVAMAVGPSELIKIGEKLARESTDRVRGDFPAGGSRGSQGGGEDIVDAFSLTTEEFEAKVSEFRKNAYKY